MPFISKAEKFGIEKAKLEIAKHLIEEGVKLSIIEKTTGFSSAKLKKLQKEINQSEKKQRPLIFSKHKSAIPRPKP
jgi:ABC-type Na+ transport system ATPase subunit NatA